jgi:hypothetical protein
MPDTFGSISTSQASISNTAYACGVANCFIQGQQAAEVSGVDLPTFFSRLQIVLVR